MKKRINEIITHKNILFNVTSPTRHLKRGAGLVMVEAVILIFGIIYFCSD